MGLDYLAFGSLIIGSIILAALNYFTRRKTPKDNLVQGNIAVISGLIFLFSILSDWIMSGELIISGPEIETLFPEMPIIGTSFNFMFVFATLIILGGFLLVIDYEIGRKLIKIGGILSVMFSIIFILLFSLFPMTRPYWIAWITLLSSIISFISIYIGRKKRTTDL